MPANAGDNIGPPDARGETLWQCGCIVAYLIGETGCSSGGNRWVSPQIGISWRYGMVPSPPPDGSKLDRFTDLLESSVISVRRRPFGPALGRIFRDFFQRPIDSCSAQLMTDESGLQPAGRLPVWVIQH